MASHRITLVMTFPFDVMKVKNVFCQTLRGESITSSRVPPNSKPRHSLQQRCESRVAARYARFMTKSQVQGTSHHHHCRRRVGSACIPRLWRKSSKPKLKNPTFTHSVMSTMSTKWCNTEPGVFWNRIRWMDGRRKWLFKSVFKLFVWGFLFDSVTW